MLSAKAWSATPAINCTHTGQPAGLCQAACVLPRGQSDSPQPVKSVETAPSPQGSVRDAERGHPPLHRCKHQRHRPGYRTVSLEGHWLQAMCWCLLVWEDGIWRNHIIRRICKHGQSLDRSPQRQPHTRASVSSPTTCDGTCSRRRHTKFAQQITLCKCRGLYGGLGQIGTADTRIFNPLLYQLSYKAVWCVGEIPAVVRARKIGPSWGSARPCWVSAAARSHAARRNTVGSRCAYSKLIVPRS